MYELTKERIRAYVLKCLTHAESVSVALLTVFVLVTSLYDLGNVPNALYYDEISAGYLPYLYSHGNPRAAVFPLGSIIVSLVSGQYFTYELVGPSAFWLRFPSAIYGVLFVIVCWALGRRLDGSRTGVIAASLAAVVPWAFYFRRWGSIITIAYAFYVTLAVYFSLMYFQKGKSKYKYGAFISIALSLYTHAMALFFDFLFFPVFFMLGLKFKCNQKKKALDILSLFVVLVLTASPLLAVYLSPSTIGLTPGLTETFYDRTSISKSNGIQLIGSMAWIGYTHLSGDFLVISGGKSLGLSPENLYFYGSGGGQIGMLSIFGVLVYFWLSWFLYETIKKKHVNFKDLLAIWWITAFAAVSGLIYYGNPNAARNIVGLPAFILIMSLVASEIFRTISKHVIKKSLLTLLKISCIIALVIPSMFYIGLYFRTYTHTKYVDVYIKDLGNYFSKYNHWDKLIVLGKNIPSMYVEELRFYSNSAGENIEQGDLVYALDLLYSSGNNSTIYFVSTLAPEFGQSSNSTQLGNLAPSEIVYSGQPPYNPIFIVSEFSKTEMEKQVLLDDNQAGQWAEVHSEFPGQRGDLVIFDDASIVKTGSNSLGVTIPSGEYDWTGIYYHFAENRNWENATAFSFWMFGANSSVPITFGIVCENGRFLYAFTDSFDGWRRFVIPFLAMNKEEFPNILQVKGFAFYSWGTGEGTIAIDDISLLIQNRTA